MGIAKATNRGSAGGESVPDSGYPRWQLVPLRMRSPEEHAAK